MPLTARNKYVTIQTRTTEQDSAGQTEETWSDSVSVWARIRPISGREFFAASGERAEITHEFSVVYGPTVRARDRLSYDGRIFDIRSVINVGEANRELLVMAVEVAP